MGAFVHGPLSILDVARAVNSANFLLPAGGIKAGRLDDNIYTNNVPKMEDLPASDEGQFRVDLYAAWSWVYTRRRGSSNAHGPERLQDQATRGWVTRRRVCRPDSVTAGPGWPGAGSRSAPA